MIPSPLNTIYSPEASAAANAELGAAIMARINEEVRRQTARTPKE